MDNTPQRFLVLKPFTLLRTRDGSMVDDGSAANRALPILGEYHEGHAYELTTVNVQGAREAVGKGLARLI